MSGDPVSGIAVKQSASVCIFSYFIADISLLPSPSRCAVMSTWPSASRYNVWHLAERFTLQRHTHRVIAQYPTATTASHHEGTGHAGSRSQPDTHSTLAGCSPDNGVTCWIGEQNNRADIVRSSCRGGSSKRTGHRSRQYCLDCVADRGRRQSGRQAEFIGEFGRRAWRGNSVGYPHPAELSTGRRQGEAAHPLHLAMRSKNDQTAATR